jgi:hypothetical protein
MAAVSFAQFIRIVFDSSIDYIQNVTHLAPAVGDEVLRRRRWSADATDRGSRLDFETE